MFVQFLDATTSHSSLIPCSQATLACSSLVAATTGWEVLRGGGLGVGRAGARWLSRGASSGIHVGLGGRAGGGSWRW